MPETRAGQRDAILLIEDDHEIRDALSELLQEAGHRVFGARDGQEALEMLETGAIPRPCLVLLDWVMHPISGGEFLEALQRRPDLAQLRVVVISGATNLEEARSHPSVVGVLQKPFDIDELLAIAHSHCGITESHAAAS
jgi:CheY-like chemotaxis protein